MKELFDPGIPVEGAARRRILKKAIRLLSNANLSTNMAPLDNDWYHEQIHYVVVLNILEPLEKTILSDDNLETVRGWHVAMESQIIADDRQSGWTTSFFWWADGGIEIDVSDLTALIA